MMILPGMVGYLTSFLLKGSERMKWLYLGVFGISGIWLVIIFVIIWTGIGNPLMGLEGENRTASILRKFQKQGWQLANGLKLKGDWDIDHVLVGPAGVLVFESKWSYKPWLSAEQSNSFMAGRIEEAVGQITRNSIQFKSFFKDKLVGVTVTPVCVLWSHSYGTEELAWFQNDGVVVIPGPVLEAWMKSITARWLDPKRVEQLSTALALQIAIRDKLDAEKENPPLPTMGTLITRNVLAPILGFCVAFLGFTLISRLQSLLVHGLLFAILIGTGVLITRRESLRRIGQGWLGACAGYFCLFIIAVIQVFTR